MRTLPPLFEVVGAVVCVIGLVLAGILTVSEYGPYPHLFLALILKKKVYPDRMPVY